jgi:hypothetical protein
MHIGFLSEGMDLLTGVLGAGSSGGSGGYSASGTNPGGGGAAFSTNISPIISPQQSNVSSPNINSPNAVTGANPTMTMPISQRFKGGSVTPSMPQGYGNPYAMPGTDLPGLDTGFFETFDIDRFAQPGGSQEEIIRAQRGIPWNTILLGVGILAATFIALKYINKKSGKK